MPLQSVVIRNCKAGPIFSLQFFIIASIELQQNWYTGKEVPVNGLQHGNRAFIDASLT